MPDEVAAPPAKVARVEPAASEEHPVVSDAEWREARLKLLEEEKALSRKSSELAAKRRALPWRELKAEYELEGPDGHVSIKDLFGDKEDLIVYHLMFESGWKKPCTLCSFFVDQFESGLVHLKQRCAFAIVGKAPYNELAEAFAAKGWRAPVYSAGNSTFSEDFCVSFTAEQVASDTCEYNYTNKWPLFLGTQAPGLSSFRKDARTGRVVHTYSTYAAGIGSVGQVLSMLDLTATGRDEVGEGKRNMWWVKHKEDYP